MVFWGVEVKPAKPFSLDYVWGELHISQATLGIGSSNNKCLVQCNVGKKSPILLCSLIPDHVECCHLAVQFQEGEQVTFSVRGQRSVHLTGYFLSNNGSHVDVKQDSESFGEDIGDTDTERSSDFRDEDDYEDSFINDSDVDVIPPSPSLDDEVAGKGKSSNKSDRRSRDSKRLKKKYVLSDSEDEFVSCKRNNGDDLIDDQSISSFCGSVKIVARDSERKMKQVSDSKRIAERKKKKKKQNKDNVGPSSLGEKGDLRSRALSDGLAIEDLVIGDENGEVASFGRQVNINYTAMLKEGSQVFDTTVGRKPLDFCLGDGVVLDGLDIGVEGMIVGGKRRILIPPTLGFGNKGSKHVPPNSWLIMDVELLQVE